MARFTSDSSREMWEARWEELWAQGRESELGPKGQAYIEKEYGQEFWPLDEDLIERDIDDWDFDIEY